MKETEGWMGYTRQELQVKRAVNTVRLEVAKENFAQRLSGNGESSTKKLGSFLFNNPAILLRTITIGSTVFSIYRRLFGRR